jgi:hypothetical protein
MGSIEFLKLLQKAEKLLLKLANVNNGDGCDTTIIFKALSKELFFLP